MYPFLFVSILSRERYCSWHAYFLAKTLFFPQFELYHGHLSFERAAIHSERFLFDDKYFSNMLDCHTCSSELFRSLFSPLYIYCQR